MIELFLAWLAWLLSLMAVKHAETYSEILETIEGSFLRERLKYIASEPRRRFLAEHEEFACEFGKSKEFRRQFFSDFPRVRERLYEWEQNDLSVRLVALIFGRPTLEIIKKQIIPDIDYWHHVSGQNIDFFCIGFYKEGSEFDAHEFEEIKREFENRSTWKYSHETDLLLMNARMNRSSVEFDFSNVVSLTIERALEEKAITSVAQFFGQIVDFTKGFNGTDPAWGFSDSQGKGIVGSALKRLLISLLPEAFREDARKAFHLYIKDFRYK